MKIVIVGAGYSGMEVARQARLLGWEVVGTTRNRETVEALEALGARGVVWDVMEDDSQQLSGYLTAQNMSRGTVVIYSLPTIFKNYERAATGLSRHLKPVDKVLAECREAHIRKFIYLSSTSVLGDHGGAWVDETVVCRPSSPYGKMRKEIEDRILEYNDAFDVCIARLTGIYGPGRTMEGLIKSGRYTLVDGGKKLTNRIHVEDIGQAVLAMVARAPAGGHIYHLSDGHPIAVRALVEFICQRLGLELPPEESLEDYARRKQNPNVVGRWKNTYKCKNARLTEELGVVLKYPDALKGYESIFDGQGN